MEALLDLEPVRDLDTPPAPRPRPRWHAHLPWVLFGLAMAALIVSLTVLLRPPAPTPEPPPPPPANPDVTVAVSDGIQGDLTVLRDAAGDVMVATIAVGPVGDEAVWCSITVNGREVTTEGVDGIPAVCFWVRGALV